MFKVSGEVAAISLGGTFDFKCLPLSHAVFFLICSRGFAFNVVFGP